MECSFSLIAKLTEVERSEKSEILHERRLIMVFAIESIAACVLFTVLLEIATVNRREVFVNDYPPVVTDKLRQIGLIAEKPPAKKVILFAS